MKKYTYIIGIVVAILASCDQVEIESGTGVLQPIEFVIGDRPMYGGGADTRTTWDPTNPGTGAVNWAVGDVLHVRMIFPSQSIADITGTVELTDTGWQTTMQWPATATSANIIAYYLGTSGAPGSAMYDQELYYAFKTGVTNGATIVLDEFSTQINNMYTNAFTFTGIPEDGYLWLRGSGWAGFVINSTLNFLYYNNFVTAKAFGPISGGEKTFYLVTGITTNSILSGNCEFALGMDDESTPADWTNIKANISTILGAQGYGNHFTIRLDTGTAGPGDIEP